MKKLVTIILALTIACSTALAQDKDQEKKNQELEKKIDELMMEIEIMKATSGSGEQKEEKFKLFGYFGARYQDMNYESKKTNSDGNPYYGTTTAARIPDQSSFVHNNLNIYFQFNPIENFRVLSEIRFMYYPGGTPDNSELDRSTMVPFVTNKFYATNPATGKRTWYSANGTVIVGNNNIATGAVDLPINKDGTVAVRTGYNSGFEGNSQPIQTYSPEAGGYVNVPGKYLPIGFLPVDSEGKYILPDASAPGTYFRIDTSGKILGKTTSSSIVFTDTPLMKSAMLRDNRIENYFVDHSSAFWGQYGSINVERAFMEWTPSNAYGFRFGKFFTPFGIWNVDHGTPVLLTARVPYFLTYLPDTQMGLEVFGRYNFPHTDLDYSVYVSNGRGLIKELEDNNEEKAFGGRMSLKLQMPLFKELAIGGSGYYGKHEEKTVQLGLNYNYNVSENGVSIVNDNGNDASMTTEYKTVAQADELVLGLDLKAVFQDISFQSEYMYRKWDFTFFDSEYVHQWASFYYPPTTEPIEEVTAYYVQLAYKMPWEFKGVSFTPFGRWEKVDGYIKSKGYYLTAEDSGYKNEFDNISLGLNIRQNPYVVYKLDYTFAKFKDRERLDFNVFTATADIAF